MKPVLCKCLQCKHNHAWRKKMVKSRRSRARTDVRVGLRQLSEDHPARFYVGYTD